MRWFNFFKKKENQLWNKKVILIISNEFPKDDYIKSEIAKCGNYHVVFAETGKDGIKLSRRISPSMIFLDWDVESPSSSEVIYQIRRLKRTRNIPLCLLMRGGRILDYELIQIAGIKDYITKPFAIEKIIDLIRLRTSK